MDVGRTSRGAGFTLVELMAVVAIIGIVSAIALPQVLGAREKAKNTTCDHLFYSLDGEISNEIDHVINKGSPSCGNMGTPWNDMKVIRCVISKHTVENNPRDKLKKVFVNYLESPGGFESCQVGLDECEGGPSSWAVCIQVRQFPHPLGAERTFSIRLD